MLENEGKPYGIQKGHFTNLLMKVHFLDDVAERCHTVTPS